MASIAIRLQQRDFVRRILRQALDLLNQQPDDQIADLFHDETVSEIRSYLTLSL